MLPVIDTTQNNCQHDSPPRRKEKKGFSSNHHMCTSFFLGRNPTPHKRTLFVDLDNTLVFAVRTGVAQQMGPEALAHASFSFMIGDEQTSLTATRYTVFVRPGCLSFLEGASK